MKFQTSLLMALASITTANTVVLSEAFFQTTSTQAVAWSKKVANTTFSAVKVLASGNFVNSEHPTKGLAELVTTNGKNYLRLNKEFKSEDGPDLFVILHEQNPPKAYDDSNYLSLGRLKKTAGEQIYEIPMGADIKSFKSVVIWCKQFNATFGFASLE